LEELIVGPPVAATEAVPERGELAVIVVEVQVVHCVAGGAVDDGRVVRILAIVNQDSPDVDEDEEGDVGPLGEREQKGEYVVGKTLCVAVCRVKSVRGEGSRHDPLVVWLMDVFVHARVVQSTVDPVDEGIGEEKEEGDLRIVVPSSRTLFRCVVKLGVPAYFGKEPGYGKDGHDGKGNVGLLHLKLDLVLEVSWVVEGGLVEDEEVRCAREDIVYDDTEEPRIALSAEIRRAVFGAAHTM
jgi:hypothetical protein